MVSREEVQLSFSARAACSGADLVTLWYCGRLRLKAEISSDLVTDEELRVEFVNRKEYLDFQLSVTKRGFWSINQLGMAPGALHLRIILFLKWHLNIASSLCNPLRISFFPSKGLGVLIADN